MNNHEDSVEYSQLLDHNSPIPLHHQITEILRKKTIKGSFIDESGKLPSEMELAALFNVSRITVRTALIKLMDEGLLSRKRGRGTFLKTNLVENWAGQLMGFSETFMANGLQPGAEVIKSGMTKVLTKKVKDKLKADEAWELKRLRFADGKPVSIEHTFHPIEIGLKLQNLNLEKLLTYKFIEQDLNIIIGEAIQQISAMNAGKEESRLLQVPEDQALLYAERLTLSSDHKPIEFLQAIYRPDYFQYTVKLNRHQNN